MENQILKELQKINSRFDNLETRFDNLEGDLKEFKQEVLEKFGVIEQRLDRVEQRLDTLEKRTDAIEKYSRDGFDVLVDLAHEVVSRKEYNELKKKVEINTKDIFELRAKIG